MKFLIFNLAVVAALLYLFTADGGKVEQMAGRAQEAAKELKTLARQSVGKTRDLAVRSISEPQPKAKLPQKTVQEKPAKKNKPVPARSEDSRIRSAKLGEKPARPVASLAALRRRLEVLEGVPEKAAAPQASRRAERPMTGAKRRRELEDLADEMDLFHVRTLGR